MPQMQCEFPGQGIQSTFDINDWTIKRKNECNRRDFLIDLLEEGEARLKKT